MNTDAIGLRVIGLEDPMEAIERCYELGWTDRLPGLPLPVRHAPGCSACTPAHGPGTPTRRSGPRHKARTPKARPWRSRCASMAHEKLRSPIRSRRARIAARPQRYRLPKAFSHNCPFSGASIPCRRTRSPFTSSVSPSITRVSSPMMVVSAPSTANSQPATHTTMIKMRDSKAKPSISGAIFSHFPC